MAQDRTKALPNTFLPYLRRLHQEGLDEEQDRHGCYDTFVLKEGTVGRDMPAKARRKANRHDSHTKLAAIKNTLASGIPGKWHNAD